MPVERPAVIKATAELKVHSTRTESRLSSMKDAGTGFC